jgi:transcriptional regulator with XRE-family HTH domain
VVRSGGSRAREIDVKTSSYREPDYAFGQLMLTLRTHIGLTQAGLGERLQVSRRAVVEWEAGLSYPKVDRLKGFIALCVQQQAFSVGREEEEIQALWKAARQRVLLDELWLHTLLSSAHPEAIVPAHGATADSGSDSLHRIAPIVSAPTRSFPRIDWTGALDVSSFRGREVELAVLSRWLLQERCRMVAVLGMGGIGKSALVSLLGQQLAPQFDAVLWRSVRDAPCCEDLVADCLTFCSDTPPAEFPPRWNNASIS